MFSRNQLLRIYQSYGKQPDVEYYTGDMEHIRTYYQTRSVQEPDRFYIDDTTWQDLNMDAVYKRINAGLSTAGEQYLYYMLRRPMDRRQFEQHQMLTDLADREPDTRKGLQKILWRIGRYRPIDLDSMLTTRTASPFWLVFYSILSLLVLPVLVLTFIRPDVGIWILLPVLITNSILHEYRTTRCQREIHTVNYCVGLAQALSKVKKLGHPVLDAQLQNAYTHLEKLRSILRIGPVLTGSRGDIVSMLMTVLLWDLISFELLKNRFARHQAHFAVIHEAVGQLDASIAIASWRASMDRWALPQLDFDAQEAFLEADEVVHPLLDAPIPNDVSLPRPLLITGANASGKSTYLKAVILCALLAQTTGTAPCARYRSSPFRIYTSMAIADSIQAGESYYIAEIRSLKRILDARQDGSPVLCAVDEVLRGTNTIERIAASTEILRTLGASGTLALVATHDAELCDLVADQYQLAHFQEEITDKDIRFDYHIRPGKATSRNAIDLLRLMGFDAAIVDAAHKRASGYLETGRWGGTASPQQGANS